MNKIQNLCSMNKIYGKHIGEYLEDKIIRMGLKKSAVAEKLGMSRQNFKPTVLDKPELPMTVIKKIQDALGSDIFDEFFEHNPDLMPFKTEGKPSFTIEESTEVTKSSKLGFHMHLEIDPENFNPEKFSKFGYEIEKILKKL